MSNHWFWWFAIDLIVMKISFHAWFCSLSLVNDEHFGRLPPMLRTAARNPMCFTYGLKSISLGIGILRAYIPGHLTIWWLRLLIINVYIHEFILHSKMEQKQVKLISSNHIKINPAHGQLRMWPEWQRSLCSSKEVELAMVGIKSVREINCCKGPWVIVSRDMCTI